MNPITYEPSPVIADKLSTYLRTETEALFRLPVDDSSPNGIMSYGAWKSTPEGRLHMQLMARYAVGMDSVDAKRVNSMQMRLQAQGRESKGRPRVFDRRKASLTYQRKVKLYLLDKLIAKALGLDPELIRKPFEIDCPPARSEPADTYEALRRFEAWTGLTLPTAAWLLYTKDERARMHEARPSMEHGGDGCVTLKAYKLAKSVVRLVASADATPPSTGE